MLKRICIALCFVLLVPFVCYGAEPQISAYSAISYDASTGTVLYDKNAKIERSMASTTKIMTCLIACESNQLDDIVEISDKMLEGAVGSLIYIKSGDKISLYDLVVGAMLASGNDSANAIAVYLGKTVKGFAYMMNEKAKEIGLKNSKFVTPSGLDEGEHHSTAYDMALLSAYALKNNYFSDICAMKSAQITINDEKQTIYNHNKLLSYNKSFVGVKTGYTEKAGRCLVSAFDYKDNLIIVVTLNAPNDWDDHKKIVDYSKKKYNEYKEELSFEINVVGGTENSVKCISKYDAFSLDEISVKAYYYPFIYAPIKAGDSVGWIEVIDNNDIKMTVEIIAKEDVELWQETMK